MKKFVLTCLMAVAAGSVMAAQGQFTIVRPLDGAKVRETVKVQMPSTSIPAKGYVGVFINGKFVEAIVPTSSGKDNKYTEYSLDTKTLEDGPVKLELKLFVEFNEQPRIVDTSSVDLVIANKSSIPIPDGGVTMGYRFSPGTERIYRVQEKMIFSGIDEKEQKKGSRPFQMEQDGESFKYLIACDNNYSNGDGLVRLQLVPDRGYKNREFSYVTVNGGSQQTVHASNSMMGIYMRLRPNGDEVWGAIPDYFGFNGQGTPSRSVLIGAFPLPMLPIKKVKPGDSWPSNILMGALAFSERYTMKSVTQRVPARSEFIGTEWEMGHPCAKIKTTLSQGLGEAAPKSDDPKAKDLQERISKGKVQIEQITWFALDTKMVIKTYQDIITDSVQDLGINTTGGASSGGGGGNAGASGAGGRERRPGQRGGGQIGDDFQLRDRQAGGLSLPGGGKNKGQGPNGSAGAGPSGGANAGGGGTQGGGTLTRVRRQLLMVLQQ